MYDQETEMFYWYLAIVLGCLQPILAASPLSPQHPHTISRFIKWGESKLDSWAHLGQHCLQLAASQGLKPITAGIPR